jgi:hypothetical protein
VRGWDGIYFSSMYREKMLPDGRLESAGRQKEEVCPENEGIEVSFSVVLNRFPR